MEIEGARSETERETAHDIVSMLRAALMTMQSLNTRVNNYPYNHHAPGMLYSIGLIERGFHLKSDKAE